MSGNLAMKNQKKFK